MADQASGQRTRTVQQVLCVALLAWVAVWIGQIAPGWVAGLPPAYPGQYARRFYFGLTMAGILGAVLAGRGPEGAPRWRRGLCWALLGVAVAGLALQVWHDRAVTAPGAA